MRRAGFIALLAAVVGSSALWPTAARATFHFIMITEVFAGTTAEPDAQFVELQMYSGGQNQLATHSVVVYDAAGVQQGTFTFTGNVPNGADQSYVLLATQEAESAFGVQADLEMTPIVARAGGKVCWEPTLMIDCVSWGSYSAGGSDQGGNATGTPFNQTTGLLPDQSMTRDTTGGSRPKRLDEGDDTNDSAADFQGAAATPVPNTSDPSPSPSPSDGPAVERHDRSINLRLSGRLDAKGRVRVDDGFDQCSSKVPVLVQKKRGGEWSVVERTRTNGRGSYDVHLPNSPGTYRARAKAFMATDSDDCAQATSKTARN
jgi:hypothetical protein